MILDPDYPGRFSLFSPSHVAVMISIALLWIAVPFILKKMKNRKADSAFRYILASLLLGQYIAWIIWEIITGRFTIELSLPLNLCDISNFLCAVLLLTKSHKLFEILYFWALAGTIQSYITPNIFFAFPHLEFFVFYIQHGGEILTILFFTFVLGYRPKAVSMLKSFGTLLLFVLFVYIINLLINSNYMFLMADTPQPSTITRMIDIFGNPPLHMIGLTIIAVPSHLLLYTPFAIKDGLFKLRIKNNNRE